MPFARAAHSQRFERGQPTRFAILHVRRSFQNPQRDRRKPAAVAALPATVLATLESTEVSPAAPAPRPAARLASTGRLNPWWTSSMLSKAMSLEPARKSGPVHLLGKAFLKFHQSTGKRLSLSR